MRIASEGIDPVRDEHEVMASLLPLSGAKVLELGCGKAEKTRFVASKAKSVLALEVDEIQLETNRLISDLPNVNFEYGGAQNIPEGDGRFDIVLMFKSLHHVPIGHMDDAFSEIHRVLKPGGLAYISEPVYAGEFNEVLRLFHNEREVREAAFQAVMRAASSNRFSHLGQHFFMTKSHFDDFGDFERKIIGVTHTRHELSPCLLGEVREKFETYMGESGADFLVPIRVDLLQREG